MKNRLTRQIVHVSLAVLGLVIIIVGIIKGTDGALVVGIIVSGVNAQQWIQLNKKRKNQNATKPK